MSDSTSYEVYVSPYDKTILTFELKSGLKGFKLMYYNIKRDIDSTINDILTKFKISKRKPNEMVYSSCSSILYDNISSINILTDHNQCYDPDKGFIELSEYTLDIYATSLENSKELKIYRIRTTNTHVCNTIKNNFDKLNKNN